METVLSEIAALHTEIKALTKIVRKIRSTQEDPSGEKAKSRAENNGFNRTLEVSQKLRDFLKLEADSSVSRSDVTRLINKYITENGLKHPDNGRVIILDDNLRTLLEPPEGVQVTFLNIQKYLGPHYIKVPKPVKEADAPTNPDEPIVPKVTKRPVVRKPKVAAAAPTPVTAAA
jgi:upstream activation factor subunit UAF30